MFTQVIYTGDPDHHKESDRSFYVPLPGNSFLINDQRMQGSSRKIELEPGLSLQSWEVKLLEDGRFSKFVPESIDDPLYFLHYFISPPSGRFLIQEQSYVVNNLDKLNVFLSWDLPVDLVFRKGDLISCLTLIFSRSWLVDQLRKSQGIDYILPEWASRDKPLFFPNKTLVTEQLIVDELFVLAQHRQSLFLIKADVFQLLDNKFRRVEGNIEFPALRSLSEQMVIQLEKKIVSSLTTAMPNIQDLAKEFYTSPSTLKRHFKAFFGENIYSYYLHKKMNLARQMLTESNLRVSEIAGKLGYDSVSHFVTMFKKIHKVSPGQIRKGGGHDQED